MATFEFIFFCICSLLCLLGGVATVAAKNPIRGAMGLLTTIIGIAGMYLLLNAEMLAAVQVVVYAGAVVILFLFVIMLLGPVAAQEPDARGAISRYVGAAVMLAASLAGLLLLVGVVGAMAVARGRHGDAVLQKSRADEIKSKGPRQPSLVAPLSPNKPTTGARPSKAAAAATKALHSKEIAP